jgi:hypothetical protein
MSLCAVMFFTPAAYQALPGLLARLVTAGLVPEGELRCQAPELLHNGQLGSSSDRSSGSQRRDGSNPVNGHSEAVASNNAGYLHARRSASMETPGRPI